MKKIHLLVHGAKLSSTQLPSRLIDGAKLNCSTEILNSIMSCKRNKQVFSLRDKSVWDIL